MSLMWWVAIWLILSVPCAIILFASAVTGGSSDFNPDESNSMAENAFNITILLLGYSFYFAILAVGAATAVCLFPLTIWLMLSNKKKELDIKQKKEDDIKRFEEWKNLER